MSRCNYEPYLYSNGDNRVPAEYVPRFSSFIRHSADFLERECHVQRVEAVARINYGKNTRMKENLFIKRINEIFESSPRRFCSS